MELGSLRYTGVSSLSCALALAGQLAKLLLDRQVSSILEANFVHLFFTQVRLLGFHVLRENRALLLNTHVQLPLLAGYARGLTCEIFF